MKECIFKGARQVHARTIPSDIQPQVFKSTGKTLEDVLAMKALNAFTWQPPKDKEERTRLLEIIKKGKIDHVITGGPKQ
ncbi:MAG: hypothetical protein IKJ10_00545 [Bacteroidaceae bacterium]|nr:hypothetical protein [Bacteroidaceae bacterium]